jgi:two-component system, sensor histidine kinase YesM
MVETVEALNRELKEVSQKEDFNASIGLNNVNSRIKLYFGMDYGITIFSKQGEGTSVSLSLPMQKGEQ